MTAARTVVLASALFALACSGDDAPAERDSGAPDAGSVDDGGGDGALADSDITAATLNILHGIACPAPTEQCRALDRLDLFVEWIESIGCPDVVTTQEIVAAREAAFAERLPALCSGAYSMTYAQHNTVDDVIVLSRYPVVDETATPLLGDFRFALLTSIDHPLGRVAVFSTHLASGGDLGNDPCGPSCPAECTSAGATTNRDCQAVQLVELAEAARADAVATVVAGDFNAPPGSFIHQELVTAGLEDVYDAAGGPACNPATGIGCTSGLGSDLADLESSVARMDERIDFIFADPGSCSVEPIGDGDGDGTATGHFADVPNPFSPACGPAPDPPCWPSDHGGVVVDLNCD